MAQTVRDLVAAEDHADFEAEVRDKLSYLIEKVDGLDQKVDDIKTGMARHSAAIEALTAAQPMHVRRSVRDAEEAVASPMIAKTS